MILDLGMEYSALGLGYSMEWSFQNINIRLIRLGVYSVLLSVEWSIRLGNRN